MTLIYTKVGTSKEKYLLHYLVIINKKEILV